jgi:hypothetical protein
MTEIKNDPDSEIENPTSRQQENKKGMEGLSRRTFQGGPRGSYAERSRTKSHTQDS